MLPLALARHSRLLTHLAFGVFVLATSLGASAFAAPTKVPPVALGPMTLLGDGTPPTAYEFFLQSGSSYKGDIGPFVPGVVYSLVIQGIDVTGVTGPVNRAVYFNLQDAETGSTFKHLGIQARLDSPGAGGGTLLQCYQSFTSEGLSSHGLNPLDLTASDFDLRFDFTKAGAGMPWAVTPYFRLSAGSWTPFVGGSFTGSVPFDFLGAKLVVALDHGADGTVSFDNYYVAGPTSNAWVDDDWAGMDVGDAVFAGGAYRTIDVDAFDTVQEGVDAVVGSTVNIGPGTYEGQVVITTNNLTLQGAGIGSTTIQSPPTLAASFNTGPNNFPVIFVNGATGVTVQDLTIDGLGRGNANYRFQGIAFWNGGGKLLNAEVKRIEETPFSGTQHGVAVYANNNTGGPYSLEVGNVTMTDFQKNGTVFNGNGLTIDVHDCTVTGKGSTAVTAQNGMQVSNGTGGSIANVAVSGVFYSPATVTACGLLNFAGTTVNVTGSNSFTGCQTGLYYQETNGAVSGTSVSGSTWAATLYNTLGTFKASSSGSRPAVSPIDGETTAARQPGIASLFNVSLSNGCLLGSDTVGSSGVYAYSAGGGLSVGVTNMEIKDWDAAIVAEGGAVSITANDNAITSNVTAGFDNTLSLAAQDAELNWWDAAGGPGGGNAVLGSGVDYTPWRTTGADLNAGCGFQPTADNVITPVSPGTCISTANPCVTVPMNIARTTSDHIRGYSVTFTLSPQLMLCSGVASITQGTYLSAISGTNFQVLSNGGGSYTADCAILGLPCGATAATGNLFNVAVKNSGADGTGTITVTSVIARDCDNGPVAVSPGAPLAITIDNTVPTAVANLAAAQKKTLNDADGTTKIQLTFTPPGDAATVEVYRAGFRFYPEYDDAGGTVPTTPSYPPGVPWVLTGVTASLQYDEVATPRDFWYYVVFTKDACGNVSAVSNKTTGTLNYHLGDVSDGITPGVGNNVVNTADISLLGAHYGITLVFNDLYNYLDVGPTTDFSVNARPTTDNQVQFEDLILFAINYGQVSKSRLTPAPARSDELIVLVPENVEPGGTLVAHLWAQGTGRVQGLSARLAWNAAVVEPIGVESGVFLRDQDGVAFSPAPGTIDVALLGKRDVGLSGEGDLATVRFRVVGSGDPGIAIAQVDARDATNQKIDLATSSGGDDQQHAVPRVTSLLANVPNPFNPTTKIPFTLAVGGPVELAIYTVDGRKVRSLLRDVREPGLYEVTWDGHDANGVRAASGTYYARLVAIDGTRSRTLVLLK